jgi:hypothetical protein
MEPKPAGSRQRAFLFLASLHQGMTRIPIFPRTLSLWPPTDHACQGCFTEADIIARHQEPTVNIKAHRFPPGLLCRVLLLAGAVAALSACGLRQPNLHMAQQNLPESIRVPAGNTAVLEAQGSGDLLYECQAVKRAPYEYAWLLQTPGLKLQDNSGNTVMYYPGPRSRWEHSDGSKVTAQELVEIPGNQQNLPLLRAMVKPSDTSGTLANISYIQSRRTVGGVVAAPACTAAALGMRKWVTYEADYVFWRPAA